MGWGDMELYLSEEGSLQWFGTILENSDCVGIVTLKK